MWSFIGWNPCFALCIGTCRESSLSGINWYAIYHAEAVIEISEYDISPYAKQEFSQNGIWEKRFYQSVQIHDGFRFSKGFKKINCRVLVLCGEKDKANMSAAIELKQQINHAELALISHAGHEINKDNPVELGKILSNFYRGE